MAENTTPKRSRKKREQSTPEQPQVAQDRPTVTGDSVGSGPQSPTHLGRGGDVLVQDDVLFGHAHSGPRRATPPDEEARDSAHSDTESTDEDKRS